MLSSTILLATLLYAGIGLVIFVAGFWLWDRLTPVDLWGEICKNQNVALGNMAAGIAIAISIIIAAAIHG
ncbi:putative membrane protein [Sphingomonas sp. UYAg733]